MPKRKTKDTEGVVLCLAHKDGRVACAKTGKLLNGGETQGYRRVNIGGKGGDYYEFRDLSVPDDIKEVGYKVWVGSRKYFVSVDVGGGRIQWCGHVFRSNSILSSQQVDRYAHLVG